MSALEARLEALEARNEQPADDYQRLAALAFVLNARVAELEASNQAVRSALGLDPAKPSIGPEWRTVKQVAGETGYSDSQVRKWLRYGKLKHCHAGGRVLIDASQPLPRRRVREN